MKNILVIGAVGQIGSELTMELRRRYGDGHVVAGIHKTRPSGDLAESGPLETVDATRINQLAEVVSRYKIDTIFNLAALLSAVGENRPQAAWNVGANGVFNVLEVARDQACAVFFPSSIGAFGPTTPRDNTPQETIQRPNTMYGVSKVTGELLSDYYHKRFGVDTRGLRYPGLISNVTLPGGGTTDYAVEIFYEAVENEHFVCPLQKGTFLDMMYMPDALDAAIQLMEADPDKLNHRNCYNVTAMSFDPEILAMAIRKHLPDFVMEYQVESVKQQIADSWPNKMDDSAARNDWGWNPKWDLERMTEDMLRVIRERQLKTSV